MSKYKSTLMTRGKLYGKTRKVAISATTKEHMPTTTSAGHSFIAFYDLLDSGWTGQLHYSYPYSAR